MPLLAKDILRTGQGFGESRNAVVVSVHEVLTRLEMSLNLLDVGSFLVANLLLNCLVSVLNSLADSGSHEVFLLLLNRVVVVFFELLFAVESDASLAQLIN